MFLLFNFFYILRYLYLDGINFSLEYRGVEPKNEAMSIFESHLYTRVPVPSLVLGQTKTPILPGLNLF